MWREFRGLTQSDLAGLGQSNVSRIEGGDHQARLSTMGANAAALGIGLDELVAA